jgi:translation initiation factor 2B subunit (eIF-2B alpha/beta/delta family)
MISDTDLKFYADCIRKGDNPESILRFALNSQETALTKANSTVETVETNLREAENDLRAAIERVSEAKRLISKVESTVIIPLPIVDTQVDKDALAEVIYKAWLANRADGEGLTTYDGTPNSLSYAIAEQLSVWFASSTNLPITNNESV